jgi:hypothetical protein
MGSRPFLKIASYWENNVWRKYLDDPALLPELKPEWANQHGRLYLPTDTEPATIVSTDIQPGRPLPIPVNPSDFSKTCTLTSGDVATARQLRIPGV